MQMEYPPPPLHIPFTSWTSFTASSTDDTNFNPSDIEISAKKFSHRITKAFFIDISCCLQCEIRTTRQQCCAKQINCHPIFFWFFRRITIFPPQKIKEISKLPLCHTPLRLVCDITCRGQQLRWLDSQNCQKKKTFLQI